MHDFDETLDMARTETDEDIAGNRSRLHSADSSCRLRSDTDTQILPGVLEDLIPNGQISTLPTVESIGGGAFYRAFKRFLDIVVSCAALVLMVIPMGVIAVSIARDKSGPVIFKQTREGLCGKPFRMYKFRSMIASAEDAGARWASHDDERATPLGRVLRKHHLDELPQFWNVLKGDMSLVGPRPERPVFCALFRERLIGWDQRTLVRPGMTGIAQIKGGYDLLPAEKARLDIEYIESRSTLLDLSILLRTVGTLAARKETAEMGVTL